MKVFFFRGVTGWRWRLRARNGRIIGASSEAYRVRARAIDNFIQVTSRIPWCAVPRHGEFWSLV